MEDMQWITEEEIKRYSLFAKGTGQVLGMGERMSTAVQEYTLGVRPMEGGPTLFLAPSLWGRGSSDAGS